MKWIPFQSGKQPKFNEYVFLYNETSETFSAGYLKEVSESAEGKKCKFLLHTFVGVDGVETDDPYSHYAIPVPPKSKP